MKNGYRSVATFMSTASEGKRPSDVIPLLKYLRMFRTGTSLGRSNRTGNTRRLGTAIEQTEGQEEEQIGSTALEETASRETDAGVSSAGAAKRGWFSVKGAFGALKRLRRVVEVPENAADEGKFLLMAAFVGVLTGTSGMCTTWESREAGGRGGWGGEGYRVQRLELKIACHRTMQEL